MEKRFQFTNTHTALLLYFIFSCIGCTNYETHLETAKERVNKYYAWLDENQVDSVFAYIPPDYYSKRDSVKFLNVMMNVSKYGGIASRENIRTAKEIRYKQGKAFLYITLKYKVEYKDGTTTTDEFQFLTIEADKYFDKLIKLEHTLIEKD